jgi:hypothetical protein
MTESSTPPTPSSRTPYPTPNRVPQAPRRRPSEERAAIAASSRTATQLAVLAIVIAGIALGLVVWRTIAPSAAASCQTTAWNAQAAGNELPQGWTVQGTTFDVNRRTTQFVSPDGGTDTGTPNVIATVTCFPDGAADSVSRSQAASREAGQAVNAKTDLSDGGFEASDDSGSIFLEFRHDSVVVDLAASGGATATDIETIASAYDKSLGGDGGSITPAEPTPSDDTGASPGTSDDTGSALTHDAPELEKLLPAKIGDVTMTLESTLGSAVITTDAAGRAATADLKAKGKTPDDLHYAQASDQRTDTEPLNVNVVAIDVKGLSAADTESLLLDWLQLSGVGVTKTDVTLGGKTWTKYDLGDEGPLNYFRTEGTAVIVITTDDAALAEQTAAAMH